MSVVPRALYIRVYSNSPLTDSTIHSMLLTAPDATECGW